MTWGIWSISTWLVWVDNLQLKTQGDGWEPSSPSRSCRNSVPRGLALQEVTWAVWQAIRHSKYTFISIRKKKKKKVCSPFLSVEGNEKSWASLCSERINLLTVLDLCGCLINKAVVYLLTLPYSNCRRVSDVHGFSCSPSTVKQMFCWLPLKRTDQHPNPPSGGTQRQAQIEGVSLSARNAPFSFFYHMGKKTHTCVCIKPSLCNQIILTQNTLFIFFTSI